MKISLSNETQTSNDERGANPDEPLSDREHIQARFENQIIESLESGKGIEFAPAVWADLEAQLFPNENRK